jgi:Tol biopolymer transport system component
VVGRWLTSTLIAALTLPALAAAAPDDAGLIAYDNGQSIYTIPSAGGTPTRLATGVTATWSPDGRRIAYAGPKGVWVMSATGRNRRLLIRGGSAPAWSPDGRRIAYLRSDGALVVADTHGRRRARLVSASDYENAFVGSPPFLASPTWSPSSRSVAFVAGASGAFNTDFRIVTMPARPRAPRHTVASGLMETGLGVAITGGSLAWSPDGTQLATSGATFGPQTADIRNPQIGPAYTIGVKVVSGALTPYQPAGVDFTLAAWSPTGQQMCGLTTTGTDAQGLNITSIATYALAANTVTPLATIQSPQFTSSGGCAWQLRG